jgi:hypothetical protein
MCLSQQLYSLVCAVAMLPCAIDYRLGSQETHLNIASYLASARKLMYASNSQRKQSYKGSGPRVMSK